MNYKTTRTAFERWITDNPDLSDPMYLDYVKRNGTCWGHFFREHYAKEFNKQYETVWLRRPDLWETETER